MECRSKILLKSGLIVPCGKCPSCLANKRQEWIFRLKQEYKVSKFALFFTLTYNDDNLPKDRSVNKRDVQLFLKRLRKKFAPGVCRYFIVSEYGDHTFRPHYHGLLFFSIDCDKSIYDTITNAWDKGFCKYGDVEIGSIAYCTKYCLKGTQNPFGTTPPFTLMSKMSGGLGSSYLEEMKDYHITSENLCYVVDHGDRCRMPKYYRDKIKFEVGNHILQKYKTIKEAIDANIAFIEEQSNKQRKDFAQRFRSFQNITNFDPEEARKRFNDFLAKKAKEQNDLVLKHTKKQNKF